MAETQYGLLFLKSMLITQVVEVPIAWYLLSLLIRRWESQVHLFG